MLLQVRDYIAREGRVNISQLTRYFHIDKEAILPILNIWIKKGVISIASEGASCNTCFSCNTKKVSYYEYIKNS